MVGMKAITEKVDEDLGLLRQIVKLLEEIKESLRETEKRDLYREWKQPQ